MRERYGWIDSLNAKLEHHDIAAVGIPFVRIYIITRREGGVCTLTWLRNWENASYNVSILRVVSRLLVLVCE